MKYTEHNRLETCVERHRADFDLHEPRPELWAALEQQLHGETSIVSDEPLMSVATTNKIETERQLTFTLPTEPQAPERRRAVWVERYSIAAALVVLILAAGLGEAWKSGRVAQARLGITPVMNAPISPVADAALYLAPSGGLVASGVSQNSNARLDTAVRGMETYYVSQLADRKAELSQLAPAATADWARELVELDSSYQQLKRELPRNPQPEVVLTAMNRNLQIRLDILDQQLSVHGPAQTAMNGESRGEFALADSRRIAETSLRHDQ
ncbi:MAG: hypothetical protein ACRYG7_50810 [Janthinobacterium lividum]